MKILVTNHHLHQYTGTEISTLTLCVCLSKKGHDVTVYSKYFSNYFIEEFKKNGIRPIDSLDLVLNEEFDIGHIQHNICAYEVRQKFPSLPLIMWIHGIKPYLEQPPFIDLNISYFLKNNTEGIKYLKSIGIKKNKIILFRNIVDSKKFKPKNKINKVVKNALIISNKLPLEKETIIKNVLNKLNIKYEFIGSRYKIVKNSILPNYINKADIVFTIGLGAIETMFCGRIPILFDYNYSKYEDGIVTSNNFDKLKEFNFSGRATKRIMTEKDLLSDIKKYKQEDGVLLLQKALNNYDANNNIDLLIDIYKKTIKKFVYKKMNDKDQTILFNLNQIIQETNYYTKANCYVLNKNNQILKNKDNKIEILRNELNVIKSSKFFKLWPMYNKIKKILIFFFKKK